MLDDMQIETEGRIRVEDASGSMRGTRNAGKVPVIEPDGFDFPCRGRAPRIYAKRTRRGSIRPNFTGRISFPLLHEHPPPPPLPSPPPRPLVSAAFRA